MSPASASVLPDNAELLISAGEVKAGFDRLAADLQPLVSSGEVVLLAVMTGGLFPLARISERLMGDFEIDYCHATRYLGETRGSTLHWERRPGERIAGKHVLVIDDIYDKGVTLTAVMEACRVAGAAQVHSVVGMIKDTDRDETLPLPDFSTGIVIPDVYVFGCGMDMAERWRHLPAIYALRED